MHLVTHPTGHGSSSPPRHRTNLSSGSNQHSSQATDGGTGSRHNRRWRGLTARRQAAARRTRAGEAARTPLLGCWRLELLRICPSRPRPRAAEPRTTSRRRQLLCSCSAARLLQASNASTLLLGCGQALGLSNASTLKVPSCF